MNLTKIQNSILRLIYYSYIILFTYAAAIKLMEHEKFSMQLGQSPVLTSYAGTLSIVVPLIEIVIVVFLLLPRTQIAGLFSGYLLMVSFTAYILIILNFSSFIPCSCGGILEKMDWNTHLLFNSAFVTLALLGLLISKSKSRSLALLTPVQTGAFLLVSTTLTIAFVWGLFLNSEKKVSEQNDFIRQFPMPVHVADRIIDLEVNSYYFAGVNSDSLYLGNFTSPLTVLSFTKSLHLKKRHQIQLDTILSKYQSLKLNIVGHYFYLMDGSVPCIYKGSVSNWKTKWQAGISTQFTLTVPQDSVKVVFRQFSNRFESNVLGVFSIENSVKKYLNPKILVKQEVPFFDTDGILLYNNHQKKVHYIYTYRNEIVTTDNNLQDPYSIQTIDTVSRAQISIKQLKNGERTFDQPPLVINKKAAVYANLIFVQSERLGKWDRSDKLKTASIIDIYDLNTKQYRASMYLEKVKNQNMDSFIVEGTKLYYLSGIFLAEADLGDKITRYYNPKK
ncbi:MauE/DoxX family redox-associated membrane protein [Flavobacterium tegetincola]|uniref:MauE/DoxX family redox-associated membrane protein n=1 Tax=Flavobacterium tegetincola TaxID=150172 RepID=UPI0004245152|nr:MauE/DoxX family redox-associated membrane protein [Flavobacterium tegetincola]